MKYREALRKYDDEKKLKVGSQQSYFYIGTVGDFLDNVQDVSAELYRVLKIRAENKKKEYNDRINKTPSIRTFITYAERKDKKFDFETYVAYLKQWLDTTDKMRIAYRRAVDRVDNFKPLDKRLVKNVRESDQTVDPDCVILLFEGKEAGAFWTTSEGKPGSVSIGFAVEVDEDDE